MESVSRKQRINRSSVLLLIVLSLLLSGSASGRGKIRIGATAGFNFAGISDEEESSDYMTGFRGGAIVDFGLGRFFSIVPEALFSQRGWQYIGVGEEKGITQTATLNYLEIPVNFTGKFKLRGETKITTFTGFYFAHAFSGKLKQEEEGVGKTTQKIPLGDGKEDVSPLDMGLNLGFGLELKHVFFRLQFIFGVMNISNDYFHKVNTNALSMNIGYFF